MTNSVLFMIGFALVAVVGVVLFLVFREFWTWYWKQTEQVELLKSIDDHLELLVARGQPLPAAPVPAAASAPAGPPRFPVSAAPLGAVPTSVRPTP